MSLCISLSAAITVQQDCFFFLFKCDFWGFKIRFLYLFYATNTLPSESYPCLLLFAFSLCSWANSELDILQAKTVIKTWIITPAWYMCLISYFLRSCCYFICLIVVVVEIDLLQCRLAFSSLCKMRWHWTLSLSTST